MSTKNLSSKLIFNKAIENYRKQNFKEVNNLCKKILKDNPKHYQSIFLLGILFVQSDEFQKAEKLLNKVIQINPNFADAYYNLGIVFNKKGDHSNAIKYYKKTILIQPVFIEAYLNLGNTLQKLGQFQDAVIFYKKAIKINPKSEHANYNLGNALQKLGQFQDAIIFYKKAIKINSQNVRAQNNLGIIFRELGEYYEAIKYYEKAIASYPDYADAYNNLGIAYMEIGIQRKALICYEKAVEYAPDNLIYVYQLSILKKEILDLNLKKRINTFIRKKNISKKVLAYGNFLLSKYALQKKSYKDEFNYLVKAHKFFYESEYEKFKVPVEYFFNDLSRILEIYNYKDFIDNSSLFDQKIKPIFIVGVPRSGSTLVEKIIASSSKYIPMGEETGFLINSFKEEKIFQKQNPHIYLENLLKTVLKKYKKRDLIQAKSNFVFTDKSLENFFYLGIIRSIFPEARVINCNRSPLSSIISILKNNLIQISWAHNLDHIFQYFDIYFQLIEYWQKLFPSFIYNLQYEELTSNPKTESKKLLQYCNLPWHEKCLEFYKRDDFFSKTASSLQIRKSIYHESFNQYYPYKKYLKKYLNKYSWFN